MMENWEKVEPNTWQPTEPNSELIGVLSKRESGKGAYGSNFYYILQDDAQVMLVFGSTVLDDKMNLVTEGDRIKIVFKGIVHGKEGRKDYKDFEIFKAKEEAQ